MREHAADLGILLVHGIGAQKRGETVLDFGEPLVDSVRDWLGAGNVRVIGSESAPRDGTPARMCLEIERGNEVKRVLVAESWWADTFEPPRWGQFFPWLLLCLPFVVFRATDHAISVIDTNEKLDSARARARPTQALWFGAVRLVKNVVSVAIALALAILLLVLSVILIVPQLRAAALSTQRLLLRYIGDSYVLLRSQARGATTVSQVERDLEWLETQDVGAVAILAHSQGAELVRRVLLRHRASREIDSLITFGSGIAKLRAVDRLNSRRWKGIGAYVLRVVAAAVTVGPAVAALSTDLHWVFVAVGVLVAALLVTAARKMLKDIVQAERFADELHDQLHASGLKRWLDFFATSDPVPEDALPLQKLQPKLAAAASIRIANLRSAIRDHVAYPANGEAFRPAVLAELAGLLGWTLPAPAQVVVHNARRRRERSTRWLVGARLVIAGLVAATVTLPLLDVWRGAAEDVSDWLGDAAAVLAGSWLEGDPGQYVVAVVAVVLVGAAVYGATAVLWSILASARARKLLSPSRPCGAEPVGEVTPWFVRLVYARIAKHAQRVDDDRGWYARPWFLPTVVPVLRGGFVLFGLRYLLRQHNLYDAPAADPPKRVRFIPRQIVRTEEGTQTDLLDPAMGAAGTSFGRNGPAFPVRAEMPPPEEVSEKLLKRDEFAPAKTLNLLAAAWVQFEVHDWMQHPVVREWGPDDQAPGGALDAGTPPLERIPNGRGGSPSFVSAQTHWWDASQLYGVKRKFTNALRNDRGRVKTGDALLKVIEDSMDDRPMPVPNLWLGLALFHELFALEHNTICANLEAAEGTFTDDALFNKARLINAALMAKIHTVEWTPAVIAHPTTEHSIRATWWGVLGEGTRKRIGRIGSGEVLSGIPGSRTHHDGVRYSLTEEFVAVYRMHPLIPDEVPFRQARNGAAIGAPRAFEELTAGPTKDLRGRPARLLGKIGRHDALYSLATAWPGAISLHNYPQFLRALPQPDGVPGAGGALDLARRDIERTRETALPRYNDFRRLFRLKPASSFEDITGGDANLAHEIAEVYCDVESVDLMVGLFAERKPPGFAFSDTAFRVFLLMAARRLRSDRFFTSDFTSQVYTRTGYRWVQERTLKQMLAEHFPDLEPHLRHVPNVFTPWPSA